MDTQNDGLEKVVPALNMAIFGIYVRFLGVGVTGDAWGVDFPTYKLGALDSPWASHQTR